MKGIIIPFAIDPVCALVVIDLQKGITDLPTVHPAIGIIERAGILARAFRAQNLPVVLVNLDGTAPGRTDAGPRSFAFTQEWTELAPQLDRQPSDHVVTRQRWGAFHGTDLDRYLRAQQVTQVCLVGIATSRGVESSARNAHEYGYNVALVLDAMTDVDGEAHHNSITRIFPRLGEATTTAEVLAKLAARHVGDADA